MIEIREYRPEDYMQITRRAFDQITFLNFPDPEEIARSLANGTAFTGVVRDNSAVDGEILACGGILELWKGVGEAWIVGSPLVGVYSYTFAKTVLRKLSNIARDSGLVRVQTTVDAEYLDSQRWLRWMGFVSEGRMRKYVAGRDFFRYALVMEG